MPRSTLSRWICLLWLLSLAAPKLAQAQPAIPVDDPFREVLGTKELAKARFEAEEATLRDLVHARRQAINVCFQIRKELYAAASNEPGTGAPVTLNLLLETWAKLVETELAPSDKPADQLAIRASHWLHTWETERITSVKNRSGRVSRSALMQARSARLTDEIRLLDLLDAKERSAPFLLLPAFVEGAEIYGAEGTKEFAKAQFEVSRANRHDLATARRDALAVRFEELKELYATGANEPGTSVTITLNLLLETGDQLVEAEFALSDKPADRLAVRANRWLVAWRTEQITASQFCVARVSRAALMQARGARLSAEIKLLEMLAGEDRSEPVLIHLVFGGGEENNPYGVKERAKAQFEASQAKPHELALERRNTLKIPLSIRWELYRTGANEPGGRIAPLDLLTKTAAQLLEAELAVSENPGDRLAAYEKDWELKFLAERITRAQVFVGRVSHAAYERARFHRLDAEIQLYAFRAKRKEK
jgi:hypothetical protein